MQMNESLLTERVNATQVDRIGKKVELICIWGVLALCVVVSVCVSFRYLHKVGDVSIPESGIATVALNFAKTGRLYRPLDLPPYTPVAYGPALYALLAAIAKVTGADILTLVSTGRIFSFLCYLLLGAVVYYGSKRSGHGLGISVTVALLVWADPLFIPWNATVRPDMPALLLSTLAIVLCMAPTDLSFFAAGICAGSALLFKQTYIAAAFSILVWSVWRSRYAARAIRQAGLFCIALSLPVLAATSFFVLRGDSLLSQATLMGDVALSRSVAWNLIKHEWYTPAFKLLTLSCCVGLWVAFREVSPRGDRARLVALYFATTWLIAAASSMNTGASFNYYLEPHVAIVLALPFAMHILIRDWSGVAKPVRMFLIAITAVTLLEQASTWRYAWPGNQGQASAAAIRDLVIGTRVLGTESYFSSLGRQPELLDPFLSHQLELRKHWSSAPILKEINDQQYDYVIFRLDNGKVLPYNGYFCFSKSVTDALAQNYEALCQTAEYLILVPKQRRIKAEFRNLYNTGCDRVQPDLKWVPEGSYK